MNTVVHHSSKNNSPFPPVSFLSSLPGSSVVFVPALCLLVQSIGSPAEKTGDEKSFAVDFRRGLI